MADQIFADGPIDAPAKYVVPGSSEIVPLAVQALLDGTNASGDFLPTLIFRSQAGHVIARVPVSTTVAAGGSAEVSWFPGVKNAPAASSGLTQIWNEGALWQEDGTPQSIPDSTWTKVIFSGALGPSFGDGAPVEFDQASATIRFLPFAGLGQMRWIRFSGVWAAGTGLKRLQLRFTLTGSGAVRAEDTITAAQYLPTAALTADETFQEQITYVTPYIFNVGVDHLDMTMWAYQATGLARNFEDAQAEVYLPSNATGPL